MTTFNIDKNVEPPTKTSAFNKLANDMEVNDSVLVTRSQSSKLSRAIKLTGFQTTTSKQEDGQVRVWKLDKAEK